MKFNLGNLQVDVVLITVSHFAMVLLIICYETILRIERYDFNIFLRTCLYKGYSSYSTISSRKLEVIIDCTLLAAMQNCWLKLTSNDSVKFLTQLFFCTHFVCPNLPFHYEPQYSASNASFFYSGLWESLVLKYLNSLTLST